MSRCAAEIADNFDSGPEDGGGSLYGVDGEVDQGTVRAGGFVVDPTANPPVDEGAPILSACYPAAVAASTAVLRLFYATVQPTVTLVTPTTGDITSGHVSGQFRASASSFRNQNRINLVRFYYQMTDPPQPGYTPGGGYTLATAAISQSPSGHWEATWSNSINNAKVWVRARAYDTLHCDSLPQSVWVSIDSQRPEILNKKP